MAWATPSNVADVTNVSDASTAEIAQAQAIIELYLNRVERDTDSDGWDFTWLTRAVSYQVPWMRDHPELFTIMDVDSLSQGGTLERESLVFGIRHPMNAKWLAPLARMAADRTRGGQMVSLPVGSAFDSRPHGLSHSSLEGDWSGGL